MNGILRQTRRASAKEHSHRDGNSTTCTALQLGYYQVDVFTTRVFEGNPAAVVLLESWPRSPPSTTWRRRRLSCPGTETHALRWFTPACEVDLCGHATLASAYVLLHCRNGSTAPRRRCDSPPVMLVN